MRGQVDLHPIVAGGVANLSISLCLASSMVHEVINWHMKSALKLVWTNSL